ncbi:MAG: YlxM family DNA-binding protein [Clostridia bacterium]
MEKNVKVSMLCQIYGKLLTEKQYSVLDDYYNNDLSLSEIAENLGITRQAVRDNIKKGENKLFEFEEKLGFMKRTLSQEQQIASILSELTKIQTKFSDEQIAKILENIKKELNYLVS